MTGCVIVVCILFVIYALCSHIFFRKQGFESCNKSKTCWSNIKYSGSTMTCWHQRWSIFWLVICSSIVTLAILCLLFKATVSDKSIPSLLLIHPVATHEFLWPNFSYYFVVRIYSQLYCSLLIQDSVPGIC